MFAKSGRRAKVGDSGVRIVSPTGRFREGSERVPRGHTKREEGEPVGVAVDAPRLEPRREPEGERGGRRARRVRLGSAEPLFDPLARAVEPPRLHAGSAKLARQLGEGSWAEGRLAVPPETNSASVI